MLLSSIERIRHRAILYNTGNCSTSSGKLDDRKQVSTGEAELRLMTLEAFTGVGVS